jgi:NAD(P)-dependent dehydrogenase (short-subunit alcohol dehydrogenase family)
MGVVLDKGRFGPWALVTSASSGIGKEFARQIAASGINIVLVARREALLREVGVEFSRRYGVEHRAVALDVSREDLTVYIADVPAEQLARLVAQAVHHQAQHAAGALLPVAVVHEGPCTRGASAATTAVLSLCGRHLKRPS